ncbi:MAG TPA: endolytic transglycosylase MltG [Candidatus Limnocylindrales bacterium]|nr:endolytic transglycosylase MltG [Candidatus Limnocylindrales bacterium]
MRTFFTFIVLALLGFALWFYWAALSPVNPGETKYVLLYPGWSTRHIAHTLQREGIIHSAPAFLMVHYAKGEGSLKAGEYKFDVPATALRVRDRVLRGDVFARTVVVPEGYNLYDIAAVVEQAGLGPAADFVAAAKSDLHMLRDIDPQAKSLEGYLFPDTYQFTRIDTVNEIAAAMVHRFRQTAQKIGLLGRPDIHRIVTMASIVEKETAVAEERPLVASVYFNRLDRNMALGADPTVIYAALLGGRYRGTIYQSDLQFDSPYNTYKYPGLPPGPIANPGAASLQAAMHPAQSDFLYFVSDNNGHHRFARSAEEHDRNVAAYRKAVAAPR